VSVGKTGGLTVFDKGGAVEVIDNDPASATEAPVTAPQAAGGTSTPDAPSDASEAASAATEAPAPEAALTTEAPAVAEALALAVATTSVSAAAAAVAVPHPIVVFVGCMPAAGLAVDIDLATLVAPFGRAVAAEAVNKAGQPAPVSSWQLIPYRGGAQGIAAKLDVHLGSCLRAGLDNGDGNGDAWGGLGWRRLFVDPSHPAAPECLATLSCYPGVLVVRSVGR
jgi:hypothetical protein